MTDTTRRRQMLLEPGEPLFLGADAFAISARASAFQGASTEGGAAGLSPQDMHISPVIGHPIPQAKIGDDGKLLPWSDVSPHLLWHPLLWLPPRLAIPGKVGAEGSIRDETREEWAFRVMYEVSQSGLLDRQNGWLDILALHGIDLDKSEHVERVRAWQDGAADAILDTIDLSPWLDHDGAESWARQRAVATAELLLPAAYGVHATLLHDALLEVEEDADVVATCAAALVTLASESKPTAELIVAMWEEIEQADADAGFVSGTLAGLLQTLSGTYAHAVADYRAELEANAA